MPAARTLSLTAEQAQGLQECYRQTHDANLRSRCQMVLFLGQGKSIAQSAELTFFDERTVLYWLDRYTDTGLEGLKDRPRSGRPKKSHA